MTETPKGNQQGDPHVGQEGPNPYQQPPQPPYQPPSQQPAHAYGAPPAATTQTDRNWASASHWGTLVAAWLAMGFLAPLLIMLTVGNQSPFVRRHAVESLNFQISLLIYGAAAFLFSLLTFGLGLIIVLPLGLVALVVIIVLLIQASMRASNGEEYRYPLTLRFVS